MARPVGWTDEALAALFVRVADHIAGHYQVPVTIRDVPDPFRGDLNGAEIFIDWQEAPAARLFMLLHLFGHTVQWNHGVEAPEVDLDAAAPPTAETLAAVAAYEANACAYAVTLLQELGVTGLDQWLADYAAADAAYLVEFYQTRTTDPFETFWRSGTPLLSAKPIPPFTPTKKTARTAGVVV